MSDAAQSVLAAFASPFTQNERLFTLTLTGDNGIAADLLLPHHMRGIERLFGTYLYQVEVLSADAYIEARKIIARPAQLAILQADGSERLITGIVTAFGPLSADGGMARYVMHVEPCLAVLAHRYNACVRQDMSVREVLQDVLDRHIRHNPVFERTFRVEFRLADSYPKLSYCNQYEADLHFLERIMAQYGLFYFFEFGNDNGYPVHTMVITDDHYAFQPGAQAHIRYAATRATESEDTSTQWGGLRRIQSGLVSLTSFEYKNVATERAVEQSWIDQGQAGNELASTLEDFDPRAPYYASGGELGGHARIRQQAHDFLTRQFSATSSVRGAAPATTFELRGHDVHDQDDRDTRQFVIVALVSEAQNNFLRKDDGALASLLRARPKIPEVLMNAFAKAISEVE